MDFDTPFFEKIALSAQQREGLRSPFPHPSPRLVEGELGYLACFARVLADTLKHNGKKLRSFTFLEHFCCMLAP